MKPKQIKNKSTSNREVIQYHFNVVSACNKHHSLIDNIYKTGIKRALEITNLYLRNKDLRVTNITITLNNLTEYSINIFGTVDISKVKYDTFFYVSEPLTI